MSGCCKGRRSLPAIRKWATCSSRPRAKKIRGAHFCCWARFWIRPAWLTACWRRCGRNWRREAAIIAARVEKGGESDDDFDWVYLGGFLPDLFRGRLLLQSLFFRV